MQTQTLAYMTPTPRCVVLWLTREPRLFGPLSLPFRILGVDVVKKDVRYHKDGSNVDDSVLTESNKQTKTKMRETNVKHTHTHSHTHTVCTAVFPHPHCCLCRLDYDVVSRISIRSHIPKVCLLVLTTNCMLSQIQTKQRMDVTVVNHSCGENNFLTPPCPLTCPNILMTMPTTPNGRSGVSMM